MGYHDTVLFSYTLLLVINKLISQSKFDDLLRLYDGYDLSPEKVEESIPSIVGFFDPNGDCLKTNSANSKQFSKIYQKTKSIGKLTKQTKTDSPADTSVIAKDAEEEISFDEFY